MKKPIIGVTMGSTDDPKTGAKYVKHVLNRDYVDRLAEAGAAVVLLPPGTDPLTVLPVLDGLLMTGGNDIDSSRWGEPLHPEADLEDPRRAALELELLKHADPRLPVFGICYGCQMINVHHGGGLTQHLPDVVGDDKHRGNPMQDYKVEPGSKLGQIVGPDAQGRSSHHQAVGAVAPGLRVVARHEDGTVEAVETDDDRWVIGVQWHPERSEADATPKLFESFVAAARRYQEEKAACGTW
ncbi:MAG: gamma-glutamyl-gamma-aminobutyrate hydrolase family protein [Fimbriimonadaceae bacterium]|nr:gamma-glutamyl-gamma-aminobutyrate hydrolase family protein [Fimbriimonadaceae bacterium]